MVQADSSVGHFWSADRSMAMLSWQLSYDRRTVGREALPSGALCCGSLIWSIHAGSLRQFPDGRSDCRRRSGPLSAREGLDSDHVPTTVWAWRMVLGRFLQFIIVWR